MCHRLMTISTNKIMPTRLIQLFFVILKSTVDYGSVIFPMSKSKTLIEDFARLIRVSFKKCLRLKQSTPNSVIYQIISDPRAEWRRKFLSITLTKEEKIQNVEYIQLQTETKSRQKLIWESILLSSIPFSQVIKCKICNDKFKFAPLKVHCG